MLLSFLENENLLSWKLFIFFLTLRGVEEEGCFSKIMKIKIKWIES